MSDNLDRDVTTLDPLHGRVASFLAFVFFFSGFASLMYQIAWQRLLTLYYGVGTISITLIVSVYMFGLGVGALIGGALAERIHDKLRLYFVVQLLLALFGFVSLPFLDFLGRLTAGSNYVISLWYMGSFLILPTTLMGMTLPLLTKIFIRFAKDLLSTVSYLYFLNTVGAACGALFASYVFISFFGLHAAVYCAAAIDIVLAALILRVHFLPMPEAHYQYALHLVHPHADHTSQVQHHQFSASPVDCGAELSRASSAYVLPTFGRRQGGQASRLRGSGQRSILDRHGSWFHQNSAGESPKNHDGLSAPLANDSKACCRGRKPTLRILCGSI